jgi:hypothetical protein
MSSAQNSTFFVVVVTNRATDAVLEVFSYGRKQHASTRRTQTRKSGVWDAKVFEVTYALGCLGATEIDYSEYDAKKQRKLERSRHR